MALTPKPGHPMDDNRSKGAARQIKGSAKELAGKLTGNTSKEIAGKIEKLAKSVPVVHAVMNNNYQDQGQRNAETLMGFL
jgi:hypothetical protein